MPCIALCCGRLDASAARMAALPARGLPGRSSQNVFARREHPNDSIQIHASAPRMSTFPTSACAGPSTPNVQASQSFHTPPSSFLPAAARMAARRSGSTRRAYRSR